MGKPPVEVADAVLERAAKALWDCQPTGHRLLAKAGYPIDWERQSGTTKRAYRMQARAVIMAAQPTVACGGCGETDPDKRCVGCRHEFVGGSAGNNAALVKRLRAELDNHRQINGLSLTPHGRLLLEAIRAIEPSAGKPA